MQLNIGNDHDDDDLLNVNKMTMSTNTEEPSIIIIVMWYYDASHVEIAVFCAQKLIPL